MATLEELLPGARVSGLSGSAAAEIVSVSRFGPDATNVVFRVNGTVGERLVYRDEAAALTLQDSGSRFGFDADGSLLKLASEALRVRSRTFSIPT